MFLRNTYRSFCLIILAVAPLVACGEGAPITTPVKIIAFGDSLSAGHNLPTDAAVPAKLQQRFAAAGHTGVRVVNMGISGDTTQDGVARLNLAIDAEPDIVLLELGANDILRQSPAKKAQKNLETIIEQLQARGITVILSGVQIPGIFVIGNRHLSDYKPMFAALADNYDIEYYPNFLAGVQGDSSMNLQDGLHPNASGTEEIARRIYPMLLEAAQDIAATKQQQ